MLILAVPKFWPDLRISFSTYWGYACLFLFLMALIGMAWSPASLKDQLYVVEKYSKLLYLPVLAIGFKRENTRQVGLHAFLVAMLITCIVSIEKYFFSTDGADPGEVFLNHIVTGYLMSFAAYLSALFFFQTKNTPPRFGYALLWVLFSYQIIFVNTGKTGIIIYLLLMAMLLLQVLSFKKALLAFVASIFILGAVFYMNKGLQNKITILAQEWQEFHQNNKDTSIGYRLQFHAFSKQLLLRSPWIGNGTGSFTYYFQEEKPVPSWDHKLREPHSQYWLVSTEFGIVGLFLLLSFFFILYLTAWDLTKYRPIVFGLLIATLVGSLSDSMLFYSGPGYFFIVMMALCFGEIFEKK
ncbi:O-antigen ligase family protein [Legionella adelaidensis]|uniref:O-antigen ligase family protein n=1 Tax=Legionella adelaidensis TaxID=45056 RepID=UPI0010410041|nr:O-antigen ligase family protein [Legionella adelaidensis]